MRSKLVFGIAMSLIVMAAPAHAVPPPVPVFMSETTHCFMTVGNDGVVVLDQAASYRNSDADSHRVQQQQGFWNFRVPGDTDVNRKMRSAGKFNQRCDSEPYDADDMIKVPMRVRRVSGVTFRLTWALGSAPDGWRYSVRYRIGSGDHTKLRSGTATRSTSFVATDGQTYHFQAKSIRRGRSSGWSPVKTFTA
jgi:hypothetical protein